MFAFTMQTPYGRMQGRGTVSASAEALELGRVEFRLVTKSGDLVTLSATSAGMNLDALIAALESARDAATFERAEVAS